jgi:hypothetical protein
VILSNQKRHTQPALCGFFCARAGAGAQTFLRAATSILLGLGAEHKCQKTGSPDNRKDCKENKVQYDSTLLIYADGMAIDSPAHPTGWWGRKTVKTKILTDKNNF